MVRRLVVASTGSLRCYDVTLNVASWETEAPAVFICEGISGGVEGLEIEQDQCQHFLSFITAGSFPQIEYGQDESAGAAPRDPPLVHSCEW